MNVRAEVEKVSTKLEQTIQVGKLLLKIERSKEVGKIMREITALCIIAYDLEGSSLKMKVLVQ